MAKVPKTITVEVVANTTRMELALFTAELRILRMRALRIAADFEAALQRVQEILEEPLSDAPVKRPVMTVDEAADALEETL